MIIYRAIIPTNSLVLIHEKVGDKLNPYIWYLRATSMTTDTHDKLRPHKNVRIHMTESRKAYVKFNYGKSKEIINLDEIIETLMTHGAQDVWVHDLKLRLRHGLGLFDFLFKNQPITPGTEAERYVERYLVRMRSSGFIKLARLRHLPMVTALSIPEGANMDRVELESREFVKWLSEKTFGLVKMKTMEKVSQDTYRDVTIIEADS